MKNTRIRLHNKKTLAVICHDKVNDGAVGRNWQSEDMMRKNWQLDSIKVRNKIRHKGTDWNENQILRHMETDNHKPGKKVENWMQQKERVINVELCKIRGKMLVDWPSNSNENFHGCKSGVLWKQQCCHQCDISFRLPVYLNTFPRRKWWEHNVNIWKIKRKTQEIRQMRNFNTWSWLLAIGYRGADDPLLLVVEVADDSLSLVIQELTTHYYWL